jgi:6-phosphogluconolactonase/glucosamine-6-phosphate isomerase/deaminase
MKLKLFQNQQDWINSILAEINLMPKGSIVALAGGNTPIPIYKQNTNFKPTYVLTDEREDFSNTKMLRAHMPKANILPAEITTNLPSLDLLILGMGTDGHFASHFSNSEIIQPGKFFEQVKVENNPFPNRITLNLKTLSKFKRKLLVTNGNEKLKTLKSLPDSHFIIQNQFTVYHCSK